MESPASRRMRKAGRNIMAGYFVIFFASFYADMRLHPTGVGLWALAILPVIPIIGVIVLFGRYLQDERDEFKRDVVVRCLLWGTAGCLATDMAANYLRIYGWKGDFPPFMSFWVFITFLLAAKLSYRAQNRIPADE